MQIIIHGSEIARKELLSNAMDVPFVHFVSSVQNFLDYLDADAFIDLSFDMPDDMMPTLKSLNGLVIINSVVDTLAEIDPSFVRINGWPGCLHSALIEASYVHETSREKAEVIFRQINKSVEWLPHEPGFITPRVISMIINEAYFSLEEGVSTKEDIDTAMKLGTAYPYGPFEWGQKIGLKNIVQLLTHLSKENERYAPAPLLVQEALTAKD